MAPLNYDVCVAKFPAEQYILLITIFPIVTSRIVFGGYTNFAFCISAARFLNMCSHTVSTVEFAAYSEKLRETRQQNIYIAV